MNIETLLPYHWLKHCSEEVVALDKIPLLGNPPAFPWDNFSKELRVALALQNLQVRPAETAWREKGTLAAGLGNDPLIVQIKVAPLEGNLFWIFPKEALKVLFQAAVGSEEALFPELQKEWEKEFYHFVIFEAIQAFHQVKYDTALFPQIGEDGLLPDSACFCIDIAIEAEGHNFPGRLAIEPAFEEAFRTRFAAGSGMRYPKEFAAATTVTLRIAAGSAELSRKEWNSIEPGDLLLIYPRGEQKEGNVLLKLDNRALFQAKLDERKITLLDYPLLNEERTPMAKKEEFEDEDENFETEEDSEFNDEFTEDELTEEEHTEEEEEPTEAEAHTETEIEEEKEQEEHTEEEPVKPSTPPKKEVSATAVPGKKAPLLKPEEIPMTLTVEIGRLQLTLGQLMDLKPGNVIDLQIPPEKEVDLTLNGRCIGRGELLKIGAALGVRILEKA